MIRKKIWLSAIALGLAIGLSACNKKESDESKPSFLKSLFKGSISKQTNMDITIQASNVMADLFKYRLAIDACLSQGKKLDETSIALQPDPSLAADRCFIALGSSNLRDEDIILELDDNQVPTISSIIGGEANDKIFGHMMSMTRSGDNQWRCRTSIQLAYIPVGCEYRY